MLSALQGIPLRTFHSLGSRFTSGCPPLFSPCTGVFGNLRYYNTYKFRVFLHVCSEYFIHYVRFSLIVSPLLPPSLLIFSAYSDLFLGGFYVYYMFLKPFVQRFDDRQVISIFMFHPHPQNTTYIFAFSATLWAFFWVGKDWNSYIRCFMYVLAL